MVKEYVEHMYAPGNERVGIVGPVIYDFYDKLKSLSRGYASLDYELRGYEEADLVKLDIQINGEKVDALSLIVHRENSVYRGRDLATRMRKLIPRQMFDVAVQAAIGAFQMSDRAQATRFASAMAD